MNLKRNLNYLWDQSINNFGNIGRNIKDLQKAFLKSQNMNINKYKQGVDQEYP